MHSATKIIISYGREKVKCFLKKFGIPVLEMKNQARVSYNVYNHSMGKVCYYNNNLRNASDTKVLTYQGEKESWESEER